LNHETVHGNLGNICVFLFVFCFFNLTLQPNFIQLEAPDLSDVVDEIFDMAKPENKDRVTLTDLERSKTAHTVTTLFAHAIQA